MNDYSTNHCELTSVHHTFQVSKLNLAKLLNLNSKGNSNVTVNKFIKFYVVGCRQRVSEYIFAALSA